MRLLVAAVLGILLGVLWIMTADLLFDGTARSLVPLHGALFLCVAGAAWWASRGASLGAAILAPLVGLFVVVALWWAFLWFVVFPGVEG